MKLSSTIKRKVPIFIPYRQKDGDVFVLAVYTRKTFYSSVRIIRGDKKELL